jgi:hypothetical protein
MNFFFTVECAVCDGSHDWETDDIEVLMAAIRSWIEAHECKVQPGRAEVIGWSQ